VVEAVRRVHRRDVEVGQPVVVVVAEVDALDVSIALDARGLRDVLERAVAAVAEELAGEVLVPAAVFVPEVEVEVAVVVDVGRRGGLARRGDLDPRLERAVDESAVGLLDQQRIGDLAEVVLSCAALQ